MGSTSDIRAGGAFVEITSKDEKLSAGLLAARSKLKRFGSDIRNVGRSAGSLSLLGEHATAANSSLGALGAGIKGVSASLSLLATGGPIGVLAGLAVAAMAYESAMHAAAAAAKEAADKTQHLREEGDKSRATDIERMTRLGELSQQQSLNNEDVSEAADIIRALNKEHGDLGLSIEHNTGRILGFAKANDTLNASLKQQAKLQIESEIHAKQRELRAVNALRQNGFRPGEWLSDQADNLFGDGHQKENRESEQRLQAQDLEKQIGADLDRLKLLNGPDKNTRNQALAGDALKTQHKIASEGVAAGQRLAKLDEEAAERKMSALDKEIAHLRLAGEERKKALQAQIQAEKHRDAAAGGTRNDVLVGLNKQLGEVAGNTEQDVLAAKQAAQEKEISARVDRERVAADEIAKLQIETTKTGMAQKLALLDLERQKAVELAEVHGDDIGQVDRLYALKEQLARQHEQSPLKDFGTFASGALDQIGGGAAEIPAKQLDALEAANNNLVAVKKAVEKAAPTYGR